MTKKHFIALADYVRRIRGQEDVGVSNRVISLLADFCAEQNPRLNRERWLGYIKGENGPNGDKMK